MKNITRVITWLRNQIEKHTGQTPKPDPAMEADIQSRAESPPKDLGQKQIGWRAELKAGCYEHGSETARATRAMKTDSAVQKALDEEAETRALVAIPERFSQSDAFDQRVMIKLQQGDGARTDHLTQADVCASDVRTRDEDLARLGPLPPFPFAPALLWWTAVIGIMFSLGAILHDLMFGLTPMLRWIVAAGIGGSFAIFIVSAALPNIEPEETHGQLTAFPVGNNGVFLAGFITSIAFFLARLALCRTRYDLFLAIGTALSEVGILIYVKWRGARLHEERNGWAAKRDAILRGENLRDVAKRDEERHLAKAAELKSQIIQLEQEHLIDRVRGVDKDTVVAMAVKAMRAGYLAQIAINRGSGVPPTREKNS